MIGWETHVWDKHGKLLYEDATPGMGVSNGIEIDKDDNLYVMAEPLRIDNTKPYFLKHTNTWVKFKAQKGKFISSGRKRVPVPLEGKAAPDRPKDLGSGWVENAQWFYGGVGFAGGRSGGRSCICWNTRPALDLFARSFLPEIDRYSQRSMASFICPNASAGSSWMALIPSEW